LFKELYAVRQKYETDRKIIDEYFMGKNKCKVYCESLFNTILNKINMKIDKKPVMIIQQHKDFVIAIDNIITCRNAALGHWDLLQQHISKGINVKPDRIVGLCNLVMLLDLFVCGAFRSAYIPFAVFQVCEHNNPKIKKAFFANPTIKDGYSEITESKSKELITEASNWLGWFPSVGEYDSKEWNKNSAIGKFVKFLSSLKTANDFDSNTEKKIYEAVEKIYNFMCRSENNAFGIAKQDGYNWENLTPKNALGNKM